MSRVSAEVVRSKLSYNPKTGEFVWQQSPARAVKAGSVAGFTHPSGHRYISICGRSYSAHRVAWLYVYGAWPHLQIDHIDGNPANNSISNLREVTRTQNLQYARKARRDNRSGLLGVSYRNDNKKWQARIQRNGVSVSLGVFDTPEEAHLVYLMYKIYF